MNLVERARAFAQKAHEGQVRKYSGVPYFTHPTRVADAVQKLTGNEYVIAAAYLHDVIEDCEVSYATIKDEFGLVVADLVQELTNPSKGHPELRRADRKEMDRMHISEISANAQLVKAVDRLDNLNELNGSDNGFKRKYAGESLLLADVLTKAPTKLVQQLRQLCVDILDD